ncbi:UNVERIFIED_CONTAM: putative ABC transport system ATP-binding protein [Acetivibrio alkalicellulosi]
MGYINAVEVHNVVKSYNVGFQKIDVLKNISFSVKKGEFLSIMGASGCGKSTLLYLIGGLDQATKGTIILNGKNLNKLKENEQSAMRRREVGFVFQFYNLVPNLTIEENILLPLLIDGKSYRKNKSKLNNILKIIQMEDKKNRYPNELSGGQQQRVAIARALLFEPEIILADEPTGNLDSKTGSEIMRLFKSINKDFNKTIIQVTHSEEAASYGTDILRIKDGEIESKKSNFKTG